MTSEQLQVVKEITIATLDKMKFSTTMNLTQYNDEIVNVTCKAFKMISETVLECANPDKQNCNC